jgi:hypothetical protein
MRSAACCNGLREALGQSASDRLVSWGYVTLLVDSSQRAASITREHLVPPLEAAESYNLSQVLEQVKANKGGHVSD